MVSRLLTKLVLVVAAVSQIAISSPAHAAKSPKTIAVEQQMESKLLSLQQKIKEGKPVTKEEGRELTRLLHDYLVKLAGDIDRDLKAGRFADADKEIKEFAKESKFLEKLGNPFLSDPLKFKQLSDAELIVVASAFVRVKSMVASIEAALKEGRYSEAKTILLPQFQRMSGAIHDLGHSKATVKLYQRIFVLVEKAKKKIGIPAGTYKFVNETFRYVVKITWNGLDLQIISNGGGQFPKKIEGWTAAAKGKVPKALVKLIWQTVGVHRSKR